MSTEKVKVVLDIEAEVGKIEGALKTLRGDMSNLQLPKGIGKDFENRMSKLSDEIKNFHNLASKMGNSLEGAGKIDASYKKILEYTRKVENSLTAIKEEAGVDATKFFPKEIVDRIEKAEQAMKDYEAAIEKGRDAYKQEINDLKAVEKQLDNLRKKQISLEGTKTSKKTTLSETKERQKQVVQQANLTKQTSSQEQVAIQKRIALLKEEKEAIKVVQKAQEEASKTKVALKSVKGYDKGNLTQQKSYDSKKRNDDEARANLQRAQEAAKAYGDTLRSIPDIEAEIAAQNQALKQQETIYNQADAAIKKVNAEVDKASAAYNKANQELQDNTNQINQYVQEQERLNNAIKSGEAVAKNGAMNALANALKEINIIIDPTTQSLEEVKNIINNLKPEAIQQLIQALKNADINVDALELGLTELGNKNKVFQEGAQYARQMNNQMEQLKGHVQQFFSLTNSVMLFRRGIQKAFESVKELDAAMTETAVVTDFSVGDMWDQLPRYTKAANELGTTTLGAYETMTLFYQQGLETNEVFEIGTETMKMARIAGLDYANATDLMTAALRGFNMELNEASATRINDVYSELAAITAADTGEIANAMTKTASIAANANMEFETTAALLSQIIETTREPAETAGTAMKTIIARFTEMKKSASEVVNVDGEEVNANKVEAALKSAGVALRDVNGEFRDLDDVFLELSSKWNGLDKMTQRYVATMAAGSRQQSRFIAMMQDYDRTMELVDAAYNSSGASQKQFEKTQESLESKINKLKNAWNEFLMGIANSDVIKAGVDALTGLLNVINKLTGKSGIAKLSVAILGLKTGSAIFNGLFKTFTPLKGIMNKQGQDTADSFLGGLTQRITNFRLGNGAYTNVQVETGQAHSKIALLKQDFATLKASMTDPVIPIGTITGLEMVDGKLMQTVVTAEGATETIEMGLSEVGLKALMASQCIDENGDEFVEVGVKGKAAMDVLQKEYLETIALAKALDVAEDGEMVTGTINGRVLNVRANDTSRRVAWSRASSLGKDTKAMQTATNSMAGSTGHTAGFLSQIASKLGPIAKWVAIIAAVVAAISAAVYAIYENSTFKKVQDAAKLATNSVENYGRALESCRKEQDALNGFVDILNQQDAALENLIKGSVEWYTTIQKNNIALLEQIDLLKNLGYDIDYSYDDQGQIEVNNLEEFRKAQKEIVDRELKLIQGEQAAISYSRVMNTRSEQVTENSDKEADAFWDGFVDSFWSDKNLNKAIAAAAAGAAGGTMIGGPLLTWIGGIGGYAIGWIGSAIEDGIAASQQVVDEYSKTGFYAELSKDQKEALDLEAKRAAASTWINYAESEEEIKAGQRIIENIDDAAEFFYSPETFNNRYSNLSYGTELEHEVLKYNGAEIDDEDLTKIITELGYSNWTEAAEAIGLKYDSSQVGAAGLYVEGEDDEKQYIQVSKFGTIDTPDNWEDFINNPGGKDIDAGFLALMLGEAASTRKGGTIDTIMSRALTPDVIEKTLYGDENWGNYTKDAAEGKTGIEASIGKTINEANNRRREIYNSLFNTTFKDGTNVFDQIDTTLIQQLSGQIQRLEVDTNTQTALAFQSFITHQQGLIARQQQLEEGGSVKLLERPQIDASKLVEAGWEDAGTGIATVYSSTFSNEDGSVAMNFTPILPNGEVLSPQELEEYANDVINGAADTKGLKIGATFEGENAIDQASAAAEEIHQLQEEYYAGEFSTDQIDEYYNLFSKLDITNSVSSLEILNQEIEKGSEEAERLKNIYTQRGSELDLSNQFEDLLTSGILDEIGEEISKISDEAGNIDVTATRELVDSNTELKNIMDEFNVSGYAMGKILSDIQKGEITLTDINNGLVESYKLLYSAMGQAEDVLYDLRNADLGEDYTEIGRTYEERYDTIKDLYKRSAYGSENFAGNIKSLIGDEAWQNYLMTNDNNTKKAWEQISKDYFLSQNDGNLYGSFSSLISKYGSSAFKNVGNTIQYDLSQFKTYDEVLDHMVEAFGISREYAKAMLADMATYSETLQNDLNALNAAANANEVFNNMYREDATDKDPGTSYTDLSNTKIAEIFGQTQQWTEAIQKAKNETKNWDLLSLAEQTNKAAEAFKKINKIDNTVSIGDKKYQIEKIDSEGNKYYRDENKKLKVQSSDDSSNNYRNVTYVTEELSPTAPYSDAYQIATGNKRVVSSTKETNESYGNRLKEDANVQAMAVELNDEEFTAWLDKYTGEENAIQILADVGVSRESLSSIEMAKNEFLTQIGGIVDGLKQIKITIPVTISREAAIALTGKDPGEDGLKTAITIGGEETSIVNTTTGENAMGTIIADAAAEYAKFTANQSGNGAGYQGHDPTNGGDGGGGDDDRDKSDFEKESDRIKAKIDELDSAIENLADNDIVDMQMVNQLIEQKIALQKEYKKALERELEIISATTDEIWNDVKKAGNDKYIKYNEETGSYGYTDAYYEDFFKDGVSIDSEQMQKVQEQASQLNKLNSDQLANQIAIKELVDNLVENQAENYNAERSLKGRERRQTEADAEEELIGMLPEEIQPFFQALNTAEDAYLEMQEIQANKVLAENLQQQLDAAYAGVPDYIKENMTFDEYSGYGLDLAKINQIEDKEAREEMLTAVQENAKILNEQYFDPLYDVKEQLSGGKLQRAILNTGKSLQELAKEISDGDIDTGLKKINTGFKALDDALNSFIKNLEDNEAIENILSTKVLPSLSLNEEQATKLISNPKLQKALQGNVPLQNFVLQAIGTEGIDLGAILGAAFGQTGGLLEQIGGFLNFDMMKILGDSGGLIEQGKQIVEQIVGKVAEVTGALIDAWTNREDILYNFLQVLEKYLHDYEVMQRYSTQLEKGRMASVDDIRQNWEQQWQSLQDQLEMQQERIETRQDQLDRSRWNPFQLISGWNPETDSLYENREIKMAFDLLISAIGMLPMGLGAFGGQLNQLYEDYDKRVQEAYEDRLAAEMAILDIEDERLELVKIGAEEATEFEQKVLDALVQKEQEQIEELSRLNDAITDANSKLISTLQKNLDQIRQDRENEKKEEELGEKERRLAYLRQDTSGANMMEIKKLEEELEEGHEDYTDTLIDQKISELEKQNEAAAEQRQQQIDLLQAQLDWSQKYGLYWDAIYGMLYTIDENGNAVLNPENFDLDGNIRENSQLAQMLGTFSDRLGMSVWSSVLDNEEAKRLGRYYGAFIGNNGVAGEWADYWALLNPGADDPDYATPDPDIPEGILGVLWNIESSLRNYFIKSDGALFDGFGHMGEKIANGLGDLLGIDSLSNYDYITNSKRTDQAPLTEMLVNGGEKMAEGWMNILSRGNKTTQGLSRTENNGVETMNIHFNIGNVGENISLDDMVDKVTVAFKEMFTGKTNLLKVGH